MLVNPRKRRGGTNSAVVCGIGKPNEDRIKKQHHDRVQVDLAAATKQSKCSINRSTVTMYSTTVVYCSSVV